MRLVITRASPGPGELTLVVVFDSRESYEANGSDPAQDAWYQQLVGLLNGKSS